MLAKLEALCSGNEEVAAAECHVTLLQTHKQPCHVMYPEPQCKEYAELNSLLAVSVAGHQNDAHVLGLIHEPGVSSNPLQLYAFLSPCGYKDLYAMGFWLKCRMEIICWFVPIFFFKKGL